MPNVILKIIGVLVAVILLTSCASAPSGAEQAARSAFEKFAQGQSVPYKDVSIKTVNNDGTYAIIRVIAWFRPSAQSDWLEQYADLEVRNVGGQWQANTWMSFQFTDAEKSRQDARAKATEVAQQATRSAIATSTAVAATATSVAFAQEQQTLWSSSDGKAILELMREFEAAKENAILTGDTSQLDSFITGAPLGELKKDVIGVNAADVWIARNPRSAVIRFVDDQHASVILIADVEKIYVYTRPRSLIDKSTNKDEKVNYEFFKTDARWYIEDCDQYVCGHYGFLK